MYLQLIAKCRCPVRDLLKFLSLIVSEQNRSENRLEVVLAARWYHKPNFTSPISGYQSVSCQCSIVKSGYILPFTSYSILKMNRKLIRPLGGATDRISSHQLVADYWFSLVFH
jgi:hypothetical protein